MKIIAKPNAESWTGFTNSEARPMGRASPVSIAVSLSSLRDFHLHKKRRAWQISGSPKAERQ
jgi:hypothetical protein